jgi:transcriptional regulator with XRE-family HTH domain
MAQTHAPFPSALRRWRHARRLSQLDLATSADTTQRHISFLESGRSLPGRDIVVRLGAALDLDLRARNTLLAAAGFNPQFPAIRLDHPDLDPVRGALRLVLDGHGPLPAVIIEQQGIAVGANAAFGLLLEGISESLLEPPINVLRMALHPDGLARRIENFPTWAPHVVRAAADRAERCGDAGLIDLVEELTLYLPPDSSDNLTAGTVAPMVLRTRHGSARLITTRMTFGNTTHSALADLELEAFLPEDQNTTQILRAQLNEPAPAAIQDALKAVNAVIP